MCSWGKCKGPGALAQDGARGACPARWVTCSVHRRIVGDEETQVLGFSSPRGSFRKAFRGHELCTAASKSLSHLGQEIIRKPRRDLCCYLSCFIERVGSSLPPGCPGQCRAHPHTPHCPCAGGPIADQSGNERLPL